MTDAAASGRLREAFDANAADILAYLERRVTPREDAADVLGETMITAWRKVARMPVEPERMRMWLFVIARNSLLNHNRGRRRASVARSRFADQFARHLPPDPADRAAEAIDVQRAVNALPGPLAELVRLVHWEQFSLVDAAALLGIPSATARSRYLRARSLLQDALQDALNERV